MTIREKLADWISGGALSEAEDMLDLYKKSYWQVNAALHTIAMATEDGKSGTAKKIHRMATEALTATTD